LPDARDSIGPKGTARNIPLPHSPRVPDSAEAVAR
jgi:hypothetical protein